jgi:hypothetical protein
MFIMFTFLSKSIAHTPARLQEEYIAHRPHLGHRTPALLQEEYIAHRPHLGPSYPCTSAGGVHCAPATPWPIVSLHVCRRSTSSIGHTLALSALPLGWHRIFSSSIGHTLASAPLHHVATASSALHHLAASASSALHHLAGSASSALHHLAGSASSALHHLTGSASSALRLSWQHQDRTLRSPRPSERLSL